jgi:hypothetical protein
MECFSLSERPMRVHFFSNVRLKPVLHEQFVGETGLPALQSKFSETPEQVEVHPPLSPSSQVSAPISFPSPQIGSHEAPISLNPALHEQTVGLVRFPPTQMKLGAGPVQSERHPTVPPESQTSVG